jgi:hypothetical protein
MKETFPLKAKKQLLDCCTTSVPVIHKKDIVNTMLSRLHFTHNLRRKLKELFSLQGDK